MTKREKQAWRARASRRLLLDVATAVRYSARIPTGYDLELARFASRLVRDFKRAIRGVR